VTVIATDNFNRANGAVGSNWSTHGGYTILTITSNTILSSAGVDYAGTYSAANAGTDDMYVKADTTTTTVDAGNNVIVLCRMPNDGTETGYWADYPAYSGNDWTLQRITNSAFTLLASHIGSDPTGTHSVQVQAVGTTISILIDGVTPSGGTVTDSTHSGSTKRYGGCHVYADNGTFCSLDNFEMGDFGASAAPVATQVIRPTAIRRAANR
jgi:hypothetical protein